MRYFFMIINLNYIFNPPYIIYFITHEHLQEEGTWNKEVSRLLFW